MDDDCLEFVEYNMFRTSHSSCSECLIFEILIGRKLFNFVSLYRSLSQALILSKNLQIIYNSH